MAVTISEIDSSMGQFTSSFSFQICMEEEIDLDVTGIVPLIYVAFP